MDATIELTWGSGGTLTVTGRGFRPREPVMLSVAVRSDSSTVSSRPGVMIQSSQSASQTTTSISADADGRIRFQSTIVAPSGTEVAVSAIGSQGSRAEARSSI
ncbi:MAG: hypothetical protein AB7R89_04490 [Dehalococcoidia bacterium]